MMSIIGSGRFKPSTAAAVAVTALVVATTVAAATTTPVRPVAQTAPSAADVLDFARTQLALCQVELHDATDSAARARAQNCITDAQRAIADLSRGTPTPTPSVTTVGPSPTVAPTSASPTPVPTTVGPSPTPSPTATSPAPTGFPDGSNTGVPAGTQLTAYTGPCTITTPNTIIDAKTVNCDLAIHTSGVVIKRSLINGSVGDDEDNSRSFTLTDSEVNAGAEVNPAVWHTNFTVLRSNVHGGQTAVSCVESCTVKDSWLHGQVHNTGQPDQHFGGFLSNGGGSQATPSLIQHNTIACDVPDTTVVINGQTHTASCSGDVNLYGDFGGVKFYDFEDNLLVAPDHCTALDCPGTPSYCAYGGTGKAGAPDHIVYRNNTFMRGLPGNGGDRHCGWWGAATNFDSTAAGDVWSGNHFEDGEVIPAPGP